MKSYTAPSSLLSDKIILVTGAADGIGKAASLCYADYGATVILLDKDIEKLEQVYDQIEEKNGPQPAIYPLNLEGACQEDYNNMAARLDEEFGRLDGILHNAALLGALSPITQYDFSLWQKVMQVNLTAPWLITQSCIPLLLKAASPSVVFTTDDVGVQGKAYWGAYGISKAGIVNLMQIFADEMEQNTAIRFNSVNPGKVATVLRAKAYPGEDPSELATAESIMPTYLYLMGDDSKSVNGQIIAAQ